MTPLVTQPAAEQASGCLSKEQAAAWQTLLRAHGRLMSGLERALAEEDLPPAPWMDVLAQLDDAEDRELRPRELGCGVQISRSGLTRLLDRMEAAGVVERRRCDEDRRGAYVTMTGRGRETLARMREVTEIELSASFARELTDEQASQLTALLALVETGD